MRLPTDHKQMKTLTTMLALPFENRQIHMQMTYGQKSPAPAPYIIQYDTMLSTMFKRIAGI